MFQLPRDPLKHLLFKLACSLKKTQEKYTKGTAALVSFHKRNEYTHIVTFCSNGTLSRACPPHSPPFFSRPSPLRGGPYPDLCHLGVQPSRTVFPCRPLLLLSPVSGAPRSPAGVHKGGLGDCSCQLEAAAARAAVPPPGRPPSGVCVPLGQQSTLPGGLCSRAPGQASGWAPLGMPRPHQQPPCQTALSQSRTLPSLPYGKLCPLCVGETQVHPLQAGSTVVHTC